MYNNGKWQVCGDMNDKTVIYIGEQRFDRLIGENRFYIEKTGFIKGIPDERIRKYGFAFVERTC